VSNNPIAKERSYLTLLRFAAGRDMHFDSRYEPGSFKVFLS